MVFQSFQPYSTQRRKINDMIKKSFVFQKTSQGVSNNLKLIGYTLNLKINLTSTICRISVF